MDAIKPVWIVKETDLPDSGGPFELVQKTIFSVIDSISGVVAFTFEGSSEASFEGPGWGPSYYSGVKNVTLTADNKFAIVEYYENYCEKVELPASVETPVKVEDKKTDTEIVYLKCPACGSERINTEIKFIGCEAFEITSCNNCHFTIDVLDEWQM